MFPTLLHGLDGCRPALLVLEDGTLWPGQAFGAGADAVGEIVFNTSLTGYQEIVTDPSYHGQIVTLTTPHIGNYGVTPEDDESDRVWAASLVVRALSPVVSNWRARQSLGDYLAERRIPAISEVDTRALVRHIRTYGAMRAAVSTSDPDPERLLELARAAPDMNGLDLAREVSCTAAYVWAADGVEQVKSTGERHVVAYDFGIKRNILRMLAARGCRVTVVPATTPAAEVLAFDPDGIFLSNGPGDPAAVGYAIEAVRQLLGRKPIFGICLGHQILALALGARTYKLKFGHRGGNQPVQVIESGAVQISSHNHGFAVAADTLPPGVVMTHVNLNDNCCEGLAATDGGAFSVQYHPESSPGPHDSAELFDRFLVMMNDAGGRR
jgi:carbamoyl-phosphate synthase small subunit